MHDQDHINAIPQERFAGRVPLWLVALQMAALGHPFGNLAPIGYRKDGSPIWPMAGGSTMNMADLEKFRSVSEYETYQESVLTRTREIDAQYQGQPFPDEVRSEWADLAELDKEITSRLRELNARNDRITALAADSRNVDGPPPIARSSSNRTVVRAQHVPEDIYSIEQYRSLSNSQDQQDQALIDGAKMAIDRATFPHERADPDKTRADLDKLFSTIDEPVSLARHILATGHPVYKRAVIKGAAGQPLFADEERVLQGNVRAQTLTSGPAGGFAVPFELDPTLILTSDGVTNPIRQISRVERITGRKWQGITSAGVTASYTATEGDEADDATMTLAQPEVETVEASAFAEYSITLDLAWGALQSQLARAFQDAKDTLEARKFVAGTGTGEPAGVSSTLAPSSNVFVGGAFGVEDVFNLKSHGSNHLPPRFQGGASFLGNGAVYDDIRMLSVGTVGQGAVWSDSLQDATPPRLLGKPAYEESEMDSDTTGAGENILVYGNFQYYLIVDRIGLTIEVVQHTFGGGGRPKTRRGALAYWMNNALILTSNAFRQLRTGTGS